MGNCLRKKAPDPNQPVEIAQPPAGVPPLRKPSAAIGKRKKRTPSVPSYSLQGAENHSIGQRPGYQQREWKRSKSQKENVSNYSKHSLPNIPRDVTVMTVKMDEVYRGYKLNSFRHRVLEAATHKFSENNIIGQGGFGNVYRGYIDPHTMTAAKRKGGRAVAVKRLRRTGFQGQNEWQNELDFLSKLNHPNVVNLIGYCCEGEHRMLIYEYMDKGSLEDHLLSENERVLSWSQRVKIALGTARGLEYIHTCWKPVIHRDVKASNVLLDKDFNAKLSDFGLAKFGPPGDKSHVSTRVLGTKGYFAPEYIATGHLTVKTDVYSFGVVLLEILLGKDAVMKYSKNGVAGIWARPYLSSMLQLSRVIDERLGKNIRMEEAQEFAQIILKCLSLEPKNRPTMTQVVADLERMELYMGGCNQDLLRLSSCKKRTPFEQFTYK